MAKLSPITVRTVTRQELIYCVQCEKHVIAYEVGGDEIYPHRPDLKDVRFFRCPNCANYVGTHKDSGNPMGTIPTPELRECRNTLHRLIDPIWRNGKMKRSDLYRLISDEVGFDFHVAEINSIEDYNYAKEVIEDLRLKLGF